MIQLRSRLPALAGALLITVAAGCVAPRQTQPPPATGSPRATTHVSDVLTPTATEGSTAATPAASVTATAGARATQAASVVAPVELTIGTDLGTDVRFIPAEASVRTDAAVSLTFQNQARVAHNLTFGPPIEMATPTLVHPDTSQTIEFESPEPGTYEFVCTLHPGMAGTLTVTP